MLNARCSERVRAELCSAVGYLGEVTAFMALDDHAHDDAYRLFRFASSCADEGGDWQLRAKVLNSMASQAICCGDPDSALTFTELALVRADRLTATEQAMLHTVRAHAPGQARSRTGRRGRRGRGRRGVQPGSPGRRPGVDGPPRRRPAHR